MNKYTAKVTDIETGYVRGFIVYGNTTAMATQAFVDQYPEFQDTDKYTYTIAISV